MTRLSNPNVHRFIDRPIVTEDKNREIHTHEVENSLFSVKMFQGKMCNLKFIKVNHLHYSSSVQSYNVTLSTYKGQEPRLSRHP